MAEDSAVPAAPAEPDQLWMPPWAKGSAPPVRAQRGTRLGEGDVPPALKAEIDPKGILNPGKMKTYEHNPFAETAV